MTARHFPVEGEADLVAEWSSYALAAGSGFFIPGAQRDPACSPQAQGCRVINLRAAA